MKMNVIYMTIDHKGYMAGYIHVNVHYPQQSCNF